MLEVRPGAVRVADPEHGRQSNALVGLQLEREPARESGPPGWVIEVPSQPEGVLVGSLGLDLRLHRTCPDSRSS